MSQSCPICHEPWTKKISNSVNNPNRVYNTCLNCYQEKPGSEWWCWDGENPSALKISIVKKSIQDRKRKEGGIPNSEFKKRKKEGESSWTQLPPPDPKRRKFDIVDSDDSVSPQLPRTATDITLERQELQLEEYNRNLVEVKEILTRIEKIIMGEGNLSQ